MENQLSRTDNCVSKVIQEHADMVFRLCFVYLKNKADAEDAFQDVFMKLFDKNPKFNDKEHIKAWLITCTTNHCKNKLRSFWNRNRVDIEDIVISITDKEEQQIINDVMELPLKYRHVIYLYYYEGYSTQEIAQLLNSKDATIRTRLRRGREILKNNLNTGGFEYE